MDSIGRNEHAFCHVQKHVTDRIDYEQHLQLVYRVTQMNSEMIVTTDENSWKFISSFFMLLKKFEYE